jgi:hypothetical protein
VDNPRQAGEKRCRKKNFFPGAFALYFAVLTAGIIPKPKSKFYLNQVWNLTEVIGNYINGLILYRPKRNGSY